MNTPSFKVLVASFFTSFILLSACGEDDSPAGTGGSTVPATGGGGTGAVGGSTTAGGGGASAVGGGGAGDPEKWTDPATGYIWQAALPAHPTNPGAYEHAVFPWSAAVDFCADLQLGGRDDWRLPSIDELRSIIFDCANTVTGGPCGVTDSCVSEPNCLNTECEGCLSCSGIEQSCIKEQLFPGKCHSFAFWSATEVQDPLYVPGAWAVLFQVGEVGLAGKDDDNYARCVCGP